MRTNGIKSADIETKFIDAEIIITLILLIIENKPKKNSNEKEKIRIQNPESRIHTQTSRMDVGYMCAMCVCGVYDLPISRPILWPSLHLFVLTKKTGIEK